MAPFKVTESTGEFELDAYVDYKTMVVLEVEVSWVSAKAEKCRMCIGDRLISIDGQPVKGMLYEDLLGLKRRRMKAGGSQKLSFAGTTPSGGFRRLTWTSLGLRPAVIVNAPKPKILIGEPKQSPEPPLRAAH